MQLTKGRKEAKKNPNHANAGKATQKDTVNYQRGLIRNMCEETPDSAGNPDAPVPVANDLFFVYSANTLIFFLDFSNTLLGDWLLFLEHL